MSLAARKAALVTGASAIALTGLAAPASAAELTLNYKCEYPLIGKRLLTVEIDTNIPGSWPEKTPTDVWNISAKSFAKEQTLTGLQLVSATSVEGTALAKSTVNVPAPGGGLVGLPANVPITVPSTPAVGDANGDLVLTATGQTPELTFPAPGAGNITVDGIQLNLIARKADGTAVTTFSSIQPGPSTDSNPDTFDVYCVLDPATQSTKLKDVNITPLGGNPDPDPDPDPEPTEDFQQPSQPGAASVSNITSSGAKISWGASTDNVGVVAYDVYNGTTKLGQSSTPTFTASGLNANTSYTLQIVARDAAGNISDERVVTFKTATATTPPPPTGNTVIPYSYSLKGSTVLRTLTSGTLPLSGSLDAKLTLETQKFEADLKLNATKGKLKALGFLPVTATVSFTNAAKTTGAVAAGGAVTSNSKVNIRLSSVNVFGIPLVAGNCRTQKPSDINLKSAAGFDILVGGRLTGSYAISNLIDCGPLTMLVSPLTSGSGNTISVDLVKK